ncbi:hypothetical protein [Streptomyces sp. NPDC093544]|jgi:hypothetical protein|uniref:hypothetical protein n=1 Tax=Streptomyces sp. NPDC093544 TaxID=3155200 RepID=UPI00343EDE2E
MAMDITSLTVILGVVVMIAAAILITFNEPPLWTCLLTGAGSLPLSAALLNTPAFTSAVGNSSVGEHVVRFAIASTLTAVLSFFVGKDSREAADDDPSTDGPPSPHPTA